MIYLENSEDKLLFEYWLEHLTSLQLLKIVEIFPPQYVKVDHKPPMVGDYKIGWQNI